MVLYTNIGIIRHVKRVQSVEERMKREHHANIRKLKDWCYDNKVNWYDFSTAPADSICVLSRNEYDLFEKRSNIEEDDECYFLDQETYELWDNGEDD